MNVSQSISRIISCFLISFMLLANLANLATNKDVNDIVNEAYSATSLEEYYTAFADTSLKIITNFISKITKGQINFVTTPPAIPSDKSKKEKKSSENTAVIVSVVPNIKDLSYINVLPAHFAIVSSFNLNEIKVVNIIYIKMFCIVSLFLVCFLSLARSDTEDNVIKNKKIYKFRLA